MPASRVVHLLRTDSVLPEAAGASPRFEHDAIAGLVFETTEWQPVPWVLAHVVDVEGNRFEVGRKARVPGRCQLGRQFQLERNLDTARR